MAYVKRQIEAERHRFPSIFWYGFFAQDVDDISDRAVIIIPDFDPTKKWRHCRWQAGVSTTSDSLGLESSGDILLESGGVLMLEGSGGTPTPLLPRKGDECIVIMDNRNNPWVVAWWPY